MTMTTTAAQATLTAWQTDQIEVAAMLHIQHDMPLTCGRGKVTVTGKQLEIAAQDPGAFSLICNLHTATIEETTTASTPALIDQYGTKHPMLLVRWGVGQVLTLMPSVVTAHEQGEAEMRHAA